MKDVEQNTALKLFESDIYQGKIPEDSKGNNSSESSGTKFPPSCLTELIMIVYWTKT